LRAKAPDGSAATKGLPMSQEPNEREAARRKLVGRGMVVLLLGLVAVYAYFTFRSQG